jgi:Leucine-rich repeat (LRR) protein
MKLNAFPFELTRPEYALIEILCLDGNSIRDIPADISQYLKNLVVFSLKKCDLRECFSEFANFMNLKELHLDFNTSIVRILWEVFDIPSLEHLGWTNLELVSPPAVIMAGNVPSARQWIRLFRGCVESGSLDIRNLKLNVFPEDTLNIAIHIHELFLEGNSFEELPSFEVFESLTFLDMQHTCWKPFEHYISFCIEMTKLVLNNCSLNIVSQHLFKLVRLRSLKLSFNNIAQLPMEICHLSSLTELLLHFNPMLRSIPQSVGTLTSLECFNLRDCSIGASLPHTLSSLTRLTFLDVTNNCITHLPPSFGHLSFVTNLLMDENCLLYPTKDLVSEGRCRWMEYLRIIDINSTTKDDTVDLSYWKLPVWPLDLFGIPTLKCLMLNGNMITDIPSKHEIPKWLQIELESKKFEGLALECETDSTIDSRSDELFSSSGSEDSMQENDFDGISKQYKTNQDSNSSKSTDDEDIDAFQAIEMSSSQELIDSKFKDQSIFEQSARITPKIARLVAKLEALLTIRNGGVIYWHSKQSVQMLPFPDISMLKQLVHLEISGNDLSKLPAGLLFITSMTYLDVSCNRIEDLSWGLAALKSLTYLNVLGNPIELLPRALLHLKKLQILEFDLDGRIVAPHITIQMEGLGAMRSFWTVIQNGLASGLFDFSKLPLPEFPLEFTLYKYGHINTPCKHLLLRQNNLESLDAFQPQYMQELLILDCSHNKLTTLPHFIKDLKFLQEIVMDHNEIVKFPWQLGWTRNLRKLCFNNNFVDQLPTSMYLLSSLTSISANHNRFEILPRNLKQFPVIVELYFAHNRIRLIPDAFIPSDTLMTLDLSHNNLTRISLALVQATSIQNLALEGNPIKSLPYGMHELVHRLAKFTLDWSKITFPPKVIVNQGTRIVERFQNECVSSVETQSLHLNNFRLDEIPRIFNKLENTTHLDISGNELLFFTLTKLEQLKILNAANNRFATLPVEFGHFLLLSDLNLASNKLAFLPATFSKLVQLKTLKISKNRLVEFPECFTRLTNLQMLFASQNLIRCIPDDIGGVNVGSVFDDFRLGMLALETLDFSMNKITAIPDSFKVLSNLCSADFTGNKIFEIPSNFKQCAQLIDMKVDWQYLTDLKPLRLDLHLTTYINVPAAYCFVFALNINSCTGCFLSCRMRKIRNFQNERFLQQSD